MGMPRRARIDAPGALHHIICRGIERRKVFQNDTDKDDFIDRLSRALTETQTPCYAWALLSNHLHLLLRTGNAPIATIMQKVLTGYVVSFNRRYRRNGHLFQNRYSLRQTLLLDISCLIRTSFFDRSMYRYLLDIMFMIRFDSNFCTRITIFTKKPCFRGNFLLFEPFF